ncbi:MAG: hypothetical protein ACJ748_01290, partial [Flavisolibacter sp.]
MPYTIAYNITTSGLEPNLNVSIYDTTTFVGGGGSQTYIQLTGAERPFSLAAIDNNRDKHTPIRAKQATIQFISGLASASTFSIGDDNRWYVEAVLNSGDVCFRGYLVMDDHQQPFLSDPQIVTLTATDNLATLKDVSLTDLSGLNPRGKNKIIQYLAWALRKTGLNLEIMVANTFMEQTYPDLPAWDHVYLDAKTFEKDINVSEDCYTVIEKILKWDCFLTQFNGNWWIGHIDEYDKPIIYSYQFDSSGNYISRNSDRTDLITSIGSTQVTKWVKEDCIVNYARPKKSVKLTYDFDYPKEIIDNIDFSRGPALGGITLPTNYYSYTLADWTTGIYLSGSTPPTDAAYIIRKIIDGYEKERYLVLKQPSTQVYYVKSNLIPVDLSDRFTIGVDTRLSANVGGSGTGFRRSGVMQVRFFGADGTYWFLHGPTSVDPDPRWVSTNSSFSTNTDFIYVEDTVGDDETQWITASCDAPPVPVAGNLEIWLINWGP